MYNTSNEAYESVKPIIPTLQSRVLDAVKDSADGLIVEDLEILLSERENSLRPRLTELAKAGLVQVKGVRRNTRGRNQKVWAVANAA